MPDHTPDTSLDHFREHGWMRVPCAFTSSEARAMCAAIWSALAATGILRDDPSTWVQARPVHLQHLKSEPVFRAVGSEPTRAAIDAALEDQPRPKPKDWGAFFLQFPFGDSWEVPTQGWHLDAGYDGAVAPPCGVKVHAMLNDVAPRSGAMLVVGGSHRLVHRWFVDHPAPAGSRNAQLRRSVLHHPYLHDLCTPGDPQARVQRFAERAEIVEGIPLQIVENTASAGDVIVMHSLLLHAAPAAHPGAQPRFVLNKDLHIRPVEPGRALRWPPVHSDA